MRDWIFLFLFSAAAALITEETFTLADTCLYETFVVDLLEQTEEHSNCYIVDLEGLFQNLVNSNLFKVH